MVDFHVLALSLCVAALLCIVWGVRRHQREHCAHLEELSDAVVALSAFIADRVPGELPEDVRSFMAAWQEQERDVEGGPAPDRNVESV